MESGNAARLQFGKQAEEYRKSRSHSDPTTLEHIMDIIAPSGGEEALDVGCGGGHMAVTLAKSIRKIMAIDITPEMLSQTNKLAVEKKLLNFNFCLADARKLPFQTKVFDIVTCRTVLHHVSNTDQAVLEMGNVLKNKGKLFIQDILGLNDPQARNYMDEIERLRDPSHIRNYNIDEWKNFLGAGGLKPLHFEIYPGVYNLEEWTSRSGTPLEQVQQIKAKLLNMPKTVQKELKATDLGGNWEIRMRYILLLATK